MASFGGLVVETCFFKGDFSGKNGGFLSGGDFIDVYRGFQVGKMNGLRVLVV